MPLRTLLPATEPGNGSVGGALALPASSPFAVGVADLNGDGDNDIVYIDGSSHALIVYPGNGDGSFQSINCMSAWERRKRTVDFQFGPSAPASSSATAR